MKVRRITKEDAADFLHLMLAMKHESEYMLAGTGTDPDSTEKMQAHLGTAACIAYFAAERDGQMIGCAVVRGNSGSLFRHRARISVCVLPGWRRRGTGRQLVEAAENWAASQDILRLEATIAAANRPALLLFGVMDYQVEGLRRASIMMADQPADEFYMAKLLRMPAQAYMVPPVR